MSTSSITPRHVLCVLGPEGWNAIAKSIVEDFGSGFDFDVEYSLESSDDRMLTAFIASSDRVAPSFKDSDRRAVQNHQSVAYILSPAMRRTDSIAVSRLVMSLVSRLLEGGALAIKSESSGIAHGLDKWSDLSVLVQKSTLSTRALYDAFVRRPISDGRELYTCGMHLLGQPDIVCRDEPEVMSAVDRMDLTADSMLADHDSGHGYPCLRYAEDDFFHNPYGYVDAFLRPASEPAKWASFFKRFLS